MNSKLAFSLLFSSLSLFSFAGTVEPTSTALVLGLFAGLLILVVFIVGLLSDRIIKLVAGNNTDGASLFNSFKEYFFGSNPSKKK